MTNAIKLSKTLIVFTILSLLPKLINAQCFISNFGSLGQLSKTTGVTALDNSFNNSKIDLESLFNVKVDIYVYYDGSSPNAFAKPSTNPAFNGLVAFGTNMLQNTLWIMNEGGYAVAGILAHEFGHVLQLKKNCSLSGMKKELHADFLAGYYFGRRSYLTSGLQNFANDLFSIGDYDFWSPQHHGTPEERVSAMLAGFNSSNLTLSAAYQKGINYVNDGDGSDDGGVQSNDNYVIVDCTHLSHPNGDFIPCSHPLHYNGDLVTCTHVCTSNFGYVPCHTYGDMISCSHPLHYNGDAIPCTHILHPNGDRIKQ
jgi:hypothetical protein